MTWIKICGTTTRADALAAVEAGADAVGFVFAASPRRIAPEAAQEIAAALPRPVDKVGVFANESAERIERVARQVGLTVIQLHGDESADFARRLFRSSDGRADGRARLRVFKAVSVMPGVEGVLRDFASSDAVDGILLDSAVLRVACMGQGTELVRGGTGVTFDWKRATDFVPGIAQRTRIILAGGLSPANVAEAVRILQPWGVDVCTGVEASPGAKDHAKVRAFVSAVRDAASPPATSH
ncbi:MAG: phosphoribosylanthranilate isomerase [Acidobacteriia bacterium]|nr:phosphoribosylanthranilate isomerase [Terriglobia bacterium]